MSYVFSMREIKRNKRELFRYLNMQSNLTKSELLEFVDLNKKAKTNVLGIRLTSEERERYEQLAAKHGRPLSHIAREHLLKSMYFFKGVKEL